MATRARLLAMTRAWAGAGNLLEERERAGLAAALIPIVRNQVLGDPQMSKKHLILDVRAYADASPDI